MSDPYERPLGALTELQILFLFGYRPEHQLLKSYQLPQNSYSCI